MGADQFEVTIFMDNPQEAFDIAKDQAYYDHGHSGYTGTIAEKDGFVVIDLPEGMTVETALKLMDEYQSRDYEKRCHSPGQVWEIRKDHIPLPEEHLPLLKRMSDIYDDKWGPALCLKTKDKDGNIGWIFCGMASS
jgi:hypothetical protein